MAWIQCCICGRKMELENGILLFRGSDEKRRYACRNCSENIASKDETVRFKIGESPFLNASNDAELYNFLDDMGIVTVTAITPAKEEKKTVSQTPVKPQQSEPETSSGWVSLLRTIVAIAIVVGIIASIAAGVTIGEESAVLGFLVAAGGSLFTLILNAAIMIFLDMADDIRAIRQKLDRM